MSGKIDEGQLDFLGLLNEYTDSQGAKVRVREPGAAKLKPVDKNVSKFSVREAEPEQLKINFEEPAVVKTEPVKVEPEAVKPEPVKPEPEPVKAVKEAPKPKPAPVKAAPEPKPEPEPVREEAPKAAPVSKPPKSGELLFKQCKKCWCFDCKHNSKNEGVPRDICGTSMPCPACESCISEDQATICEIGNAKEGCRLRAKEEGILIEEDV